MLIVSNWEGTLEPGRLYLVATEREIPIPTPETWDGRFELLPGFGLVDAAKVYRMELAREWPVRDAYVWFMAALGYNGSQALARPPVVIFDAEAERAQVDAATSVKDLGDTLNKGGSRLIDGLGGAVEGVTGLFAGAGALLALLPWIAGLALLVAAVYYGSKAVK